MTRARSGSKLLTAIISFLLGFLFAILVEVGAVFGVYWYATNTNLDKLMNTFGIQNTDSNGNKIYINTDVENGGVANLKELFAGLKDLIYADGQLSAPGHSFDEFSSLVPVTDKLLDMVFDMVDGYIEIDREEFKSTPMTDLAQVLSESLMNVKTAALFEKLGFTDITGDDANIIVKSLLMGSETEYATVYRAAAAVDGDGETTAFKLPVMYDVYIYDEDLGYSREMPVNGTSAYPENLGGNYDWLCPVSKDEEDGEFLYAKYTLYYVPCRITEYGIEEAEYRTGTYSLTDGSGSSAKTYNFSVLEYGEDTDFIVVKPDGDGNFIIDYDAVYAALNQNSTGRSDRFEGYSYFVDYAENYYYAAKDGDKYDLKTVSGKNYFRNNANELVQLDALTLGDIINDSFAPLDAVPAYTVLGEDSDMAYKVFGKTSLGELMRGEVDFNKLVDDLEVGAFVNNVTVDNTIMAYMVYRISDLERINDSYYSATYNKGGDDERKVTVRLQGNKIYEVTDANGSVIEGVKVKEIAAVAQNLDLTVLIDIDADDGIMTYLGYGVKGVTSAAGEDALGNAYTYTGKVTVNGTDKVCYINTQMQEDGTAKIISVWYVENGVKVGVAGTKVNAVSERIDGFTKDLTIGDVIDLDSSDNMLLKAIKDSPIAELESTISDLTVDKIFTEQEMAESAILRGLRGTKLSELADAIDKLLVQSIYAEEVYKLPNGGDPMEIIDFNPDYEYYVLSVKDGAVVGTFESVGKLTQEQFDNRGNTVYYTYGAESGDGAKLKIAGFNSSWLYYETNASGGFTLTEVNSGDMEEGTAKDDAFGTLTQDDYDNRGDRKYYTYGEARGMWRLVLYKNGSEKGYTINNFNNMVNSCAKNIYAATLGELYDAGLITADIKGKKFIYRDQAGSQQSVQLESLTLSGLIEIVLGMCVSE